MEFACRCSKFKMEITGSPIVSAVCYCEDCKTAGRMIEQKMNTRFLTKELGTPAVLFRKDRVRVVQGSELVESFRLKAESPTQRLLTTCCQTPIALDFTKGYWLSVYPTGLSQQFPANAKSHTFPFFARLIGNWILMGFRSPKVSGLPQ